MTPKEILIEAKRLLETKGWCQGAYAKRLHGEIALNFIGDPTVAAYCSSGAICEAQKPSMAEDAAYYFIKAIGGGPIPRWNDTPGRTKEEVLAAFDKAIELADTQQTNQQ